MSNYTRIPTTAEVCAVIRARHHEQLRVFSSYSAPDGDHYGNPEQGRMVTSYGFEGSDYPLMEAETTWDIVYNDAVRVKWERKNEQHRYWLCYPKGES